MKIVFAFCYFSKYKYFLILKNLRLSEVSPSKSLTFGLSRDPYARHFHSLSELEHILVSKDRRDADGLVGSATTAPCDMNYLFQPLTPCGIRKRDLPISCVLRSFLRFPCGTLAATIFQVDNCIVTRCA